MFIVFFNISLILLSQFTSLLINKYDLNISFIDEALITINLFFLIPKFKDLSQLKTFKYLLYFLVILVISSLINNVPAVRLLLSLKSYVGALTVYFIILLYGERGTFIKVLKGFKYLAFFIGIIGLYEYFTGSLLINEVNRYGELIDTSGLFRIQSIVGNPFDLAAILSLAFIPYVIFLGSTKFELKNKSILINCFYTIFIGLIILISGTRSILVYLFFSLGINFLFINKSFLKNNGIRLGLISIPIIYFILTSNNITVERFRNNQLFDTNEQISRINFTLKSIPIIQDNFLIGTGPGTYGNYLSNPNNSIVYQKYNVTKFGISSIDVFWPHLFVETGFFGIISYYSIFIQKLFHFRKYTIKFKNFDNNKFVISNLAICLIIFTLFSSLTSMITETSQFMFILFLFIGYIDLYLKYE